MEFDEMKKIWDTQSNQAMYAIDESALHDRVINKRNKAARIASRSEKIMIKALLFGATVIVSASVYKADYELIPLVLAAVMLGTAVFIFLRRQKRLNMQNTFDNSILGDIDLAIANAEYQVRLSSMGKGLYFIVAILSVASVVDTLDEWYKGAFLSIFFIVGYFGARWEHNTFYVTQKRNLESMREKLINLRGQDPLADEEDELL